jgi:hypothetical protein
MSADDEYQDARAGTSRRSMLAYVLLPALFFLLGIAAMGWLLSRWDEGARMIGILPEVPAPAPAAAAPPARPEAQPAAQPATEPAEPVGEPERIVIDPEITRRVSELERRIGQIDTQSRAAVGNADRAEGLLVAFAARRALDRGIALGFLEALLRERFGDSQPQAVGTVIAAARTPVTLQELQEGLRQIGPQLIGTGPDHGWWTTLRAELGGLVTVRRKGTPSPEPRERLRRANFWLESGEVAPALAEVMRLPGRAYAGDWIAKARRYVLARRALDTIETAALLEPRAAPPVPVAAAQTQRPTQQPQRPASQQRR